ncbi:Alpha/beta hydrolase fold-1 [Mycena rosella]|uniref:Alpha/beta hydrolase fold-1 n=1 Tax=Mycena rosella TaxID=1033263 RepID=A0AAD7CU49_MYCRO|nr:Alpha/beta hydrolase fold-1 [Mycena rosella]
MSKATPTILIVPGAFCPASFYGPLVSRLKDGGQEALVFDLPTASRKPPQKAATFYEDAAFFSGVIASLCKSGKDVVVMGHSYGGGVATECVRGYTAKKAGEGRVTGLVYFTAIAPLVGQAVGAVTADLGFNFGKFEGDFIYMDDLSFETAASRNFSDLPLDQGIEWVKKMPWQSVLSFQGELTYTAYKDVDSAYILCTKDKGLPPDFQRQMVENLKSGGRTVKVYELEVAHCANISEPEKVAALLTEVVKAQFM